jgi:hypothetical protein
MIVGAVGKGKGTGAGIAIVVIALVDGVEVVNGIGVVDGVGELVELGAIRMLGTPGASGNIPHCSNNLTSVVGNPKLTKLILLYYKNIILLIYELIYELQICSHYQYIFYYNTNLFSNCLLKVLSHIFLNIMKKINNLL